MSRLRLMDSDRGLAYVRMDPTADAVISSLEPAPPKRPVAPPPPPPPPDREWIPQLYREHRSTRVVAAVARLPERRVLEILTDAGVKVKPKKKRALKRSRA